VNDTSRVNLTPSLGEFTGWYNIQGDYRDGHPVLRSVDPMPEFEHAEFFKLYPKAAKWFDRLVAARPNVPFDPLLDPPFFVRCDADDRTLGVDADFSYFSVQLLRRIQKEFLGRYPLWRVILIAEHPSRSIVIYPTAIRFGSWSADVDPDKALRELVPEELASRIAGERPRREHVSRLQRLLVSAVEAIGDRPFLVCGVLDNYEGDYSRLTICLLMRGADDDVIDVDLPLGSAKDLLSRSSAFGVDTSGTIVSRTNISDTTPFNLSPWLIPASYHGPLVLVERASGKQHIYEVKPENIIRTASEE